MRYKTRSAMIGRMKRKGQDDDYPCFIHLFSSIDDPHKSGLPPDKTLHFDMVHKVVIRELDVIYLPLGNDIVINGLDEITVDTEGPHIFISGKQK
jgi:hypothetical protein